MHIAEGLRSWRTLGRTLGRRVLLALVLLPGLDAADVLAQTQPWPSRPVRIIVPFGTGGSGDITARTFGHFLERTTHQPVVIENRAGANGIIGTEFVKLAPPDGYTLLLTTNSTHAANVSLYRSIPYDPLADFEHLGLFGTQGSVLAVPAAAGVRSLTELIALARRQKQPLFYGQYNSASLMAAELFRIRAEVPMTGVAYKTIGSAATDLLGGQTQLIFFEYVSGSAYIDSGKVIPLAVTGRTRNRTWPSVPALNETWPGLELMAWLGLAAPARTPPEVLDAIAGQIARSIVDSQVHEAFERLSFTSQPMNRAEFRTFVRREIERWVEYTRLAGIKPE